MATEYIVLSIFGLCVIILLSIIIHLIYMAKTNRKRREKAKRKQVLFMIIITLIGVVSFLISLSLIISMVIQIILIEDKGSDELLRLYHSSFSEMQFCITIFDQFGHLSMVTVFIIRLKMCFNNTMFGYSKRLIRFVYCCLIVLTAFSFVIFIQIASNKNKNDVYGTILTEVVWEIVIETMCLWLLYLFISKLSELIIMSLHEDELNIIINYLVSNKTEPSHAKLEDKGSENNSSDDEDEVQLAVHQKLSNATDPNEAKDNDIKRRKQSDIYDSQIIYLVNIMTKMTVLVIIAVFGSILSVIGNILIEMNELETIKEERANMQQICLWLLPVFDMITTSICLLYLQFNFTKKFYSKFCTKIDILFLKLFGCLLKYKMKKTPIDIDTQQHKDGEYAE